MSEVDDTRRALHAVAEQLLAGPQYRASGTIRLRVREDGFETIAEPQVRVEGDELVVGGAKVALDGGTITGIAAQLGLAAGAPADLYRPQSDLSDFELRVDAVVAAKFAEAFAVGDAALRAFAPDENPVLWPEHFDVSIRLDEVNYGVSPGDSYLDAPYAYVGVDPVPSTHFWNAPFGAARALAELTGADAVAAFFADGRQAWTQSRPPAR